jgi:hypothetical protein
MKNSRKDLEKYIINLFIKETFASIPNRGVFHTFISQLNSRNYMLYHYSNSLGYRVLKDYNNQALKFTLPNWFPVKETEPIKDWNDFSKQHDLYTDIRFIREFKDQINWNKLVNPKLPWSKEFIFEFEKYLFDPYCLISHIAEIPWTEDLIDRYKDRLTWCHLSLNEGIDWSEEIIIKYEDFWDWHNLSLNRSISWTPNLLILYKERLDWTYLSSHLNLSWTDLLMDSLSAYLSWDKFTNNPYFPWDTTLMKRVEQNLKYHWVNLSKNSSASGDKVLIESFKDKWNWSLLCSNKSIIWDEDLIEKFYEQICWSSLSKNTSLQIQWEDIGKFKEKWDFDGLCANESLCIDGKFLNNYKKYITFTGSMGQRCPSRDDRYDAPSYLLNKNLRLEIPEIRYYSKKHKWNKGYFNKPYEPYEWGAFSSNGHLTHEILTEFSDYLDWETISENEHIPWTFELVMEFRELFHWNSLLRNQSFWEKIIEPLPELFDTRVIHKMFVDIYKLETNIKESKTKPFLDYFD